MTPSHASRDGPRAATDPTPGEDASYASTLVLTVTLACACFLVLMSLVLLVVHPEIAGLGSFAKFVNQQNQNAKTALYVVSFGAILPLALIAVPRLADTIARGPNGGALGLLVAALASTLALTIIIVKLSGRLPWGDGLGVLLAAIGAWCVLATIVLVRAARPTPWPLLLGLGGSAALAAVGVWTIMFGALLCVTNLKTLNAVPLVLGAAAAIAVLALHERLRLPHVGRRRGTAIDLLIVFVLLLAIPDTVIFEPSSVPPSSYFEPGIIQFQQDWILGPANQLLGGGALLVNSPVSQYGVGLVYFLAGWFHLVPIGYGTFGFLDGILTALFYVAAYCVLRIAGVTRPLAAGALALGVVALIYNLHYVVGALPEQGPLRFGPPMALIVATVAAARWPRSAGIARTAAFCVLGVTSIWALEAFAYTAVTFAASAALEAWLEPPGGRLRWLARQAMLAAGACVCAHLALAGVTLAATGQLPDWGSYLAFIHALLLGGREGSITYGFDHFSPGLAVGGACAGSATAIVLLVRRAPALAARERTRLIALTATTAYAIALFSYTDNRSSTYLLLYVTLPILIASTLWLDLMLRARQTVARRLRLGGLAFGLAVAVLLIAAAWPAVGPRFSRSALAHAYPGGGLRSILHRLWHPPPIDPRAPEGQRLLARYLPGKRALVLLPAASDLGIEILMRSGRANRLFIGDPNMDGFVPSVWVPKIRRQIAQLRPGDRLLTDSTADAVLTAVRAHPSTSPVDHFTGPGAPQVAWILWQIDKRFRLRPIHQDQDGLVVAELIARA